MNRMAVCVMIGTGEATVIGPWVGGPTIYEVSDKLTAWDYAHHAVDSRATGRLEVEAIQGPFEDMVPDHRWFLVTIHSGTVTMVPR
jgi:hypothetical protein